MTGALVYTPAPPAVRRLGCMAAVAVYAAWLLALAVLLATVFGLNFSRIFADVSQRALSALLPHHLALLQPAHSADERAAFSNAFCSLTTLIAAAPAQPEGQQALAVFNQLINTTRDRTITRAESAVFISNVWLLTAPALPPPQEPP